MQLPDPSVEKVWSLTGLAAIPVIPYRTSIHTKPLGYKFTCIQGGASTPVTWTSDSIVTMTTVCHYHTYYMHGIAMDQLVYVHLKCTFPTFLVYNSTFAAQISHHRPSTDLAFPKLQVGGERISEKGHQLNTCFFIPMPKVMDATNGC